MRLPSQQGRVKMDIGSIAGWVAPIATMLAAMMTAANLGARVTGWGFVVFSIGSVAWTIVALATDQSNLLWTNGFLTLVNMVGIWRWLGRQARYEEGGHAAKTKSAREPVPTLYPMGALAGATITDPNGETVGTIVEGMMRCTDSGLAYLVVSEGGIGGLGERLHAIKPAELRFTADGVTSLIPANSLRTRPTLARKDWPATVQQQQP
ncbi:photosystem reaction center subunit H [Niveispirillum irakense]|uniref:photosystem reaction center subunit H n=1 Tax=Niveispirillum irakense TaxID=34011 RepID=UPI000424ABC0|nr:photosystem reaction center subunit H [Niveispirillum irakense]